MKESPGKIEFTSLLVGVGPGASAVSLPVPREVSAALGNRGRVDVKGTLNGRQLRAPAMPDGKGGHTIQISRELADMLGARVGQQVKVVLERIQEEPPVEAPADLQKALAHNIQAKAVWDKFPPPARKAWVDYIAQNKKVDQRAQRVAEAVARIALGKTP
jgi:hypothetical protein